MRGGWSFYPWIRDSKTWISIWLWVCVLNDQLCRPWALLTPMDLHLLCRMAGISVSFGEVSCQITTALQIHFSWCIFRKIQSLFHKEDFSHGIQTCWSMRRGGLLSLGDTESAASVEGKKGAVFLFLPGASYCPFIFLKKISSLSRLQLCFSHSMLVILHLTFLFYRSSALLMFAWTSPLFSVSSFSCILYFLWEGGGGSLILLLINSSLW